MRVVYRKAEEESAASKVCEALDSLEAYDWIREEGGDVIVMPNLTGGCLPEANSNPEVLRGIIHYFRGHGFTVTVEGASNFRPWHEEGVDFPRIRRMLREEGLTLRDWHHDPVKVVDGWPISKRVLTCGLLVNAAVFKTHIVVPLTLTMKNMMTALVYHTPTWVKNQFHPLYAGFREVDYATAPVEEVLAAHNELCGNINRLNNIICGQTPVIGIVGGLAPMQAPGSPCGWPNPLYGWKGNTLPTSHFIMVGDHLAALDVVCGSMVGIPPEKLKYLGDDPPKVEDVELDGHPDFFIIQLETSMQRIWELI